MDNPTLLLLWIFSCLALLVMGTRLVWRKVARQPFNLGDYLTMAACLCCVTRLSLIHVVLVWGTNNIAAEIRATKVFTADEIYRRTIGSKFAITNRCFYNSFLWIQKLVLLDVYRRLLLGFQHERIIMISFLVVLLVTYVAVHVVIFCSCAKAQLELFLVGSLNIMTDIMLLAFPFVLFTSLKTSWKLKLRLFSLFTLGVFIIAITVIRLPINRSNKDSQANRSMWASTELFIATVVVNAPTIYGLWNKKRQDLAQSHQSRSGGSHPHSQGAGASSLGRKHEMGTFKISETQAYALGSMNHKRGSFRGILRTNEVVVTEHVEHKEEEEGAGMQMYDADVASTSSQRGILRD
ncbi:hypothetical protein ACJ41O_014010 [Fusarium nematophilum]